MGGAQIEPARTGSSTLAVGFRRRRLSGDQNKHEMFRLVGEAARRNGGSVDRVRMSTHYHLVVHAKVWQLSEGMKHANWRYALDFNRRYGKFGHVFAERFRSKVIESEERVFETCAYVLLDPVKAGLCDRVEDWPWSYSRYGLYAT